MPDSRPTILERWHITPEELTVAVDDNPSLRGMLLGYIAELKLSELLSSSELVTDSMKHDDHARAKKGDRVITYRGHEFIIESKSLQTRSISRTQAGWVGKAQVDASDCRTVTLPDGTTLKTTLLLFGEFDILAVNLFAFFGEWRFVFARNSDLPRTRYPRYSDNQRAHLIASLVAVTWPVEPPFYDDVFVLLDELAGEAR